MSVYVGIDVAKHELVACLLEEGKKPRTKAFRNAPAGHEALLEWAAKGRERSDLRFVMEATGIYHEEFAFFLESAGLHASVVEPRRIKHFGIGMGMRHKTDKADALYLERVAGAWGLRARPTPRGLDLAV